MIKINRNKIIEKRNSLIHAYLVSIPFLNYVFGELFGGSAMILNIVILCILAVSYTHLEMKQSDFDNLLYELGEQRDGLIKQLKDDGVTALRDEEIEMFNKLLNSEGILEMSQAFIEDNKAKVIYGPLIHYQDHIVKIDKHNRIAVLDIEFLNRHILAGLEIKSKI